MNFLCWSQPSDSGSVRKLLSDSKTLRQILEEADSLLRMFWRAALPNVEETKQVRSNCRTNALLVLQRKSDGFFSVTLFLDNIFWL